MIMIERLKKFLREHFGARLGRSFGVKGPSPFQSVPEDVRDASHDLANEVMALTARVAAIERDHITLHELVNSMRDPK